MAKSLVIIDPRVHDFTTLLTELDADAEVLILDESLDGILQIAAWLEDREDLAAIHIVSHGAEGTLYLGTTVLTASNLASYQAQWGQIGASLTETGDILLYGCNVAAGTAGIQFISSLAQYTAADVAASDDTTGVSHLGGDWVLELQTGAIDAASIQSESYEHVLEGNTAPSSLIGDGIVTTAIGTSYSGGMSVTVQPDGSILVAGASDGDFALVRYNADGSLDTSFDGDGKVTTAIGASDDSGLTVTVQADGRILVAGYSYTNTTTEFADFALVRYNADGSLDTSFSDDGKVTTAIGNVDDRGWSATVQPDGKIVVAGYSFNGSNNDFALVRYNADGSLDTSFDGDGKVTTAIGTSYDSGYSVTLQADGKILVAGNSYSGTSYDFALVRYNADGSLDTSFGGDGKVTTDVASTAMDSGESVVLQPDGKILVAGGSYSGTNYDFALVRYNADGSLDTSFSGDGKVTMAFAGGEDRGYSVVLQTDGKILVGGYGYSGTSVDFAVVRYNADGSLDTSFDGDGKVTTAVGSGNDYGRSVTLQQDGKILVAGTSFNGTINDFALIRYNADGSLDESFEPKVNTLDGTAAFTEDAAAVVLDSSVTIRDAELDALNGGLGDYAGASLTLARSTGATPEDVFSFSTSGAAFTVSGADLQAGGQTFATYALVDGALTISFTSTETVATRALVEDVLEHISYANTMEDPPASVQVVWTFADGDPSGSLTTSGTTTVNITRVNDVPVAGDDAIVVAEDATTANLVASLLANDTDADAADTFYVTGATHGSKGTVVFDDNGTPGDPNDDALIYTADGTVLDALAPGQTTTDSFTYTISDGQATDTATVTVTITGVNDAPTTFVGGKATTAIGTSYDRGYSVTLQPDGKILVAGSSYNGSNNDFAVVRYNADGSLDTSFSGDGKVTTAIGTDDDVGNSAVLQPDGKILVAGYSRNGSNTDFALVRYNADGSLDTSFSGDGKVTTAIGTGNDYGWSAALQPDGKILVAGYSYNGTNSDFALVRYNADGSLDTSFSGDAKVTTAIGTLDDRGSSASVQPDGKILVAGYSYSGTSYDFALVRYNADGSLDSSFSSDGKVRTGIGTGDDSGSSVVLQPDGKILVAGSSRNGSNYDFALVRYNALGSLDASFSGDGRVTTAIGTGDDDGNSAVLQSDGKILLAGSSRNGSNNDFAVVRYNADGSLDTSFSGDGKVTTAIGTDDDVGNSAVLQSDGKILVAGYSRNGSKDDFALVRYNADGSLDESFDPTVEPLDGTAAFTEDAVAVVLDGSIMMRDAELDVLNGGLGDYAGASLTLARNTGAMPQDVFSFSTSGAAFTVSGADLQAGGQTFATYALVDGALTISFTSTATVATRALVEDVLEHISYANTMEDPPVSVQVVWTFADGDPSGSLTTSGTTTVNITRVNDAPLAGDDAIVVAEDATTANLVASLLANDTDADAADTFYVTGATHGTKGTVVFDDHGTPGDPSDDTLTYTANGVVLDSLAPGQTTTDSFTYTISDGQATDTATVTVTITGVNDAPTTADSSLVAVEDTAIVLGLTKFPFSDADAGATLSSIRFDAFGSGRVELDGVTVTTGQEISASDIAAGLLRYVPGADVDTSDSLAFSVSDGGAWSAGSGTLSVTLAPVDDAPRVLNPLSDQFALEDSAFTWQVPADALVDVDTGDSLTFVATRPNGSDLPSWLSFNPTTRTFTATPTNAEVGRLDVKVWAMDQSGSYAADTFTLTVQNTNDGPTVAAALPDQSVTAGLAYSYTVPLGTFADVDVGDSLSYSATLSNGLPLPDWLSFDAGTRAFTGSPMLTDVGTFSIKVKATDGSGAFTSDFFALTVGENHAPTVASPLADQTATEDQAFSFVVPGETFADIDVGDSLSYDATLATGTPLPAWLTFDALPRTFAGTPGNSDVGTVTVRVTVTDGAGSAVADEFNLTVDNTNDEPELTGSAATLAAGTEDTAYVVTAAELLEGWSDVDGDVLGVSGLSVDHGSVRDNGDGTWTLTPTVDYYGPVSLTYAVGDGSTTVAATLGVDLAAVNDSPSFMVGDGNVTTSIESYNDTAYSVALQEDGRIVVGGTGGGVGPVVVRYNADGTLDTTFGGDGIVSSDVGGLSVAVQADGRILFAGTGTSGYFDGLGVSRFNTDGSLDTTFDGDGKAVTVLQYHYDAAYGIAVQSDGKIVLAGHSESPSYWDFGLVRYNADGSLDTSFSFDGIVTTSVVNEDDYAYAVAIQSDGRILVAGDAWIYGSGSSDVALVRYNTDGSLDTSFDGDGKVLTPVGTSWDQVRSIVVQSDGKILVGGSSVVGDAWNLMLVRYNPDGTLDTTFDGDGKVTTAFTADAKGSSVALQADGKIVVAGLAYNGSNNDFAVARYNTDGSLDTTFDGDGKVTTPIGALYDNGASVVVQPDGRIVVAGISQNGSNSDFAVVRYNADGSLDVTFDARATLDGAPGYTEGGAAVVLDGDVQIRDAELDALNGGAGDYHGASLTIVRNGGADADDLFGFVDGNGVTLSGNQLLKSGQVIATFDTTSVAGQLTVAFTHANGQTPTAADVDAILRQITYANGSDAPPAAVQLDWTFSDGNAGDQGTGGALSATGSTTVSITGVNDAPQAADQGLATDEDAVLDGALSATDPDGDSLTYAKASDAAHGTVSVNSDGTFTYTPLTDYYGDDAFSFTVSDGKGGTDTGWVSLTVNPVGDTVWGTAGNDSLSGDPTTDVLNGVGGDDTLNGLGGNDLLDGGDGNDALSGGAGDDLLIGGPGDDTYHVDDAGDSVTENLNEGTDLLISSVSRTLDAHVENLQLLAGAIDGTGNGLANVLYAGPGDNQLDGGAGADTLSYAFALAPVTVSLAITTAQATSGSGTDTVSGFENLTGSNHADTLTGNTGDNVLDGGLGVDTLAGGTGNDTYMVDSTSDVVQESSGAGTDRVNASASFTLPDHVERLQLVGSAAINGTGNGLDNILYPGGGNNVVSGGAGSDTVDYFYATAGVAVSLALTTAQATGGSDTDTLTSIENLTGSNHADTLTGNDFNNALNGRQGADTLIGLKGNDNYLVDHAGDVVQEAANAGLDRIKTYVSYTLSANVEQLQLLGDTAINGTGNGGDNTLYPNGGDNVIDGGSGTDTIDYYYATGAVTVSLATTAPQATGGSGTDTLLSLENLTGSNYADTLTGSDAANVIDGRFGADTLIGLGGNDDYYVDDVGDIVQEASGGGTDRILSSVTYTLPDQVERLRLTGTGAIDGTGNELSNYVWAGTGNNRLDGGAGTDTVDFCYSTGAVTASLALTTAQATGGSGTDTLLNFENLTGSNYRDTLTGNAGNNVLNGRLGNDSLTGGLGNDIFTFTTALGTTNVDTIIDFAVLDDTIRLDDAVFTALVSGTLSADAFVIGAAATDPLDRIIYNDSTGALYYDADGDGSETAIQFATVNTGLAMTAADFVVV